MRTKYEVVFPASSAPKMETKKYTVCILLGDMRKTSFVSYGLKEAKKVYNKLIASGHPGVQLWARTGKETPVRVL